MVPTEPNTRANPSCITVSPVCRNRTMMNNLTMFLQFVTAILSLFIWLFWIWWIITCSFTRSTRNIRVSFAVAAPSFYTSQLDDQTQISLVTTHCHLRIAESILINNIFSIVHNNRSHLFRYTAWFFWPFWILLFCTTGHMKWWGKKIQINHWKCRNVARTLA